MLKSLTDALRYLILSFLSLKIDPFPLKEFRMVSNKALSFWCKVIWKVGKTSQPCLYLLFLVSVREKLDSPSSEARSINTKKNKSKAS